MEISRKNAQTVGKQFHECCAAMYSWKKNIGFKHIFRCPKCHTLLKLDEEVVYKLNGEIKEEDNDEDNLMIDTGDRKV